MRLHTKTVAIIFASLLTLIFSAVFAPAAIGQLNWNGNVLSGNGDVSDPVNINGLFDVKPTGTGINILSTVSSTNIDIYGDNGSQVTFKGNVTTGNFLVRDNFLGATVNITPNVTLTTGEIQVGYIGDGISKATFNADGATIKSTIFTVGVGNKHIGFVDIANSTVSATGDIRIGYNDGSNGNAVFANSTVTTTGDIRIGNNGGSNGDAVFADSTVMPNGAFVVGFEPGSNGTVELVDTTVTAGSYFIVGRQGKGALEMTGGSITSNNNFIVGDNNANGNGTVTLTNVTVTTPVDFLLAKGGASGSVTMNADSLTSGTIKAKNFFIGGGGGSVGELFLNGGSITTTEQVRVGGDSPGYLTMTGGSIESAGTFYPGFHSHSTITQSGGTITAKGATYFADQDYETNGDTSTPVITSTYTMSKDSEFIAAGGSVHIGQHGRGILTVDGGTVTATGRDIVLGNQPKTAAYGTLNLNEVDGNYKSTVKANNLYVGNVAAAWGDVNITGGLLEIANNLIVGRNSHGTKAGGVITQYGGVITQTGGTVDVKNILAIGSLHNDGNVDATGHYLALGGDMIAKELMIGGRGTGVLTIDGGNVTVKGSNLRIGRGDTKASIGILNIESGTLTVESGFFVGNQDEAKGYVNHSGGDVILTTGILTVGGEYNNGNFNTAYGEYNATGGTVTAPEIIVGGRGTGVMTIDGGKVTATGNNFHLGRGNETYTTDGTLYMKSGSLTIGGTNTGLYIASRAHASGTLEMTGGTITTPTLSLGSENKGTLTVSGGTINATTALVLDNSNKGSTFNLIGSKSAWNLGSINSNANGLINLQIDSGGLSKLNVTGGGNAAINGAIDIRSIPGMAIVKGDSVDFVQTANGTVSGNRTYSASATQFFNESLENGNKTLSFAFNDAKIESLKFGMGDVLSFDTPQAEGWLHRNTSAECPMISQNC